MHLITQYVTVVTHINNLMIDAKVCSPFSTPPPHPKKKKKILAFSCEKFFRNCGKDVGFSHIIFTYVIEQGVTVVDC